MATHSSSLAWGSHGQGNLVGYSPWGRRESDMPERPAQQPYPPSPEHSGLSSFSTTLLGVDEVQAP